jgi:hypothetical protein
MCAMASTRGVSLGITRIYLLRNLQRAPKPVLSTLLDTRHKCY